MNDRLRVDQYLDLCFRQTEKVVRFDQLQTLVHHRL